MIEHDLVRLQKSERSNSTSAADATISAWRVRHLIRRWEERQCWSVQSIKVWTRSQPAETSESNIHTSTAALRGAMSGRSITTHYATHGFFRNVGALRVRAPH